jgi:hypothetical protein
MRLFLYVQIFQKSFFTLHWGTKVYNKSTIWFCCASMSFKFITKLMHIGPELKEMANLFDFIPPWIYILRRLMCTVEYLVLMYMHKSKSVLFNVTYWLSDWRHPVWMLRVCSTLQYKIMTSTLFPSYRHTSIRWKYQHSLNYLSTNHNKSLQRVVLLLVGRYGEGWNLRCVIVRHYNENNADVLGK